VNWHDRCPRCSCGSHRHAGPCGPKRTDVRDAERALEPVRTAYLERQISYAADALMREAYLASPDANSLGSLLADSPVLVIYLEET
jgi:hypothetical protein